MEVETFPSDQLLDKSASTISSFIQKDDAYSDLSNQLSQNGHSGSNPVLDYKLGSSFFRRDSTPIVLPQALQDSLGYAQYKAYTGFFPELNRAYLTIDSKFYLWDYNEKNSFISYDELEDIIVSVALVPPKPDIFVETVKHVLVIATTVEVILVALVNEDGRYSLSSTNYHIPSDNVNMQCIVGTENGRIFLCGMDGCLYEVVYELQDNWFRKKIQKINRSSSTFSSIFPFLKYQTNEPLLSTVHDNTRNLLYTLSASSSIQVFYLGEKYDNLSVLVELSEIQKKAKSMINSAISQAESFDIKNIFVIDKNESKDICLVAISKIGIRYYFKLETSFTGVPRNVTLFHVRLPPGLNQYVNGSSQVTQVYYFKGVSFFAEHKNNEIVDSFTVISPHYSPKQQNLSEHQYNSKLQEGSVCEIVEIPEKVLSNSSLLTWPERSRLERNKLALQHIKNPRHFLLYTGRVIETFYEVRPLDLLQDLLNVGYKSQALTEFKDTYGGDEFCCMCLILASYGISKPIQQGKIAQNAIQAFAHYAGNASFDSAQNITFSSAFDGYYFLFFPQLSCENVEISLLRLALLLARILRPIFNSPLIIKEVSPSTEPIYSMAWDTLQLMELKNELASLKTVLDRNPNIAPKESITKSLDLPSKVDRFTKLMDKSTMANKEEERQRASLHMLLDRAIEGIAFLYMIANQNLDVTALVKSLDEPVRTELEHIVFSRFLISHEGKQIHKDLVDAILAHYSETGPDKRNLMSEFLAKNCPSWFSEVDRVKTSGFELLYTAINYPKSKETERRSYLEASLEQFQNITKGIIENNILGEICNLYSLPTVKFYKGIIQLCLSCTKTVDPANIVATQIQKNKIEDLDQDLKRQKEECFEPIKKILISLIDQCQNEKEDSPFQDLLQCFKICKKSDDPHFHYYFYQLQIDKSITQDLLSVETPYLESFLKKHCKPQNYGHELLARYYSNRERFYDAAKIQISLATQADSPPSIEARVIMLHQALSSARKAQSTISVSSLESAKKDDAERLVDEIESFLEVARVQIAMKSELETFPNVVARNSAKAMISERLFSIQELFENFAVPFQLYESTLSLYKIAMVDAKENETNFVEIENVWEKIFTRVVKTQQRSVLIQRLQEKVLALGREHYPNDLVFPLSFLIANLEEYNRSIFNNAVLGQGVFWVCDSMLEVGVPHHVLIRLYWDLCDRLEKSETVIIVAVLCKLLLDYQLSLNPKELINYTSLRVDRIIDGLSTMLATFAPKERNLMLIKGCEEKLKSIKEGNEKIHPVYRSSTRYI